MKNITKSEAAFIDKKVDEAEATINVNKIEWNGDELRAEMLNDHFVDMDADKMNELTRAPLVSVKKVNIDGKEVFQLNTSNCGAVDFEEMGTYMVYQLLKTLAQGLMDVNYSEEKVTEMLQEWLQIKLDEMPNLILKELKNGNNNKVGKEKGHIN